MPTIKPIIGNKSDLSLTPMQGDITRLILPPNICISNLFFAIYLRYFEIFASLGLYIRHMFSKEMPTSVLLIPTPNKNRIKSLNMSFIVFFFTEFECVSERKSKTLTL